MSLLPDLALTLGALDGWLGSACSASAVVAANSSASDSPIAFRMLIPQALPVIKGFRRRGGAAGGAPSLTTEGYYDGSPAPDRSSARRGWAGEGQGNPSQLLVRLSTHSSLKCAVASQVRTKVIMLNADLSGSSSIQ